MLKNLWQRLFSLKDCTCHNGEKTLKDVVAGEKVRIECIRAEESVCQRLREMGFCESAVIEKISDNGGLICRICNSKVAISQSLASNIVVKDLHCVEEKK